MDPNSYEPRTPTPSSGPGSPGVVPGTAGEALAVAKPVCVDSTGKARIPTGNEQTVRSAIGFAQLAAAADGDPTLIAIEGSVATGFSGLTTGNEVYISAGTVLDQAGLGVLASGAWYRSAGVAKSATEVYVRLGEPQLVP